MALRLITAGESHGPGLTCIVEGLPAGLVLRPEDLNGDMARRQLGHGRGGRMKIERDAAEVTAGVRHGRTLGGPIALQVANRDYANWEERMSPWPVDRIPPTRSRRSTCRGPATPTWSARRSTSRATCATSSSAPPPARPPRVWPAGRSARHSCARSASRCYSHVIQIASVHAPLWERRSRPRISRRSTARRCAAWMRRQRKAMVREIDKLRKENESLGGVFEVQAFGLLPGLGSHVSWEERLDGRLAMAICSIQAIKGAAIGDGFAVAGVPGSQAHDEIFYSEERGYYRETNRSGGLEGGMTTGEPLIVRGAMKPLPTLTKPLRSVDTVSHEPAQALRERTDSCTVPAAGVVGEAMVALVLADAYRQKFGGDHIDDVLESVGAYRERIGWRTS